MTTFDEAMDHAMATAWRHSRKPENSGDGLMDVPAEMEQARAALRAIHEADRAVMKELAEALEARTALCQRLTRAANRFMFGDRTFAVWDEMGDALDAAFADGVNLGYDANTPALSHYAKVK
jgi:hypothetical protein